MNQPLEPQWDKDHGIDIDLLNAQVYVALKNKIIGSRIDKNGAIDFYLTPDGRTLVLKKLVEFNIELKDITAKNALAIAIFNNPSESYLPA